MHTPKESYVSTFKVDLIWAASSEKESSSMRAMLGFISSCAYAKFHSDICSPLKYSIVSNKSAGNEGPNQTAWMHICICPHMPEDTFSYSAAYINFQFLSQNTIVVMVLTFITLHCSIVDISLLMLRLKYRKKERKKKKKKKEKLIVARHAPFHFQMFHYES